MSDSFVVLRSRKEGELGEVSVDAVVEKLVEEVRMRALWVSPVASRCCLRLIGLHVGVSNHDKKPCHDSPKV